MRGVRLIIVVGACRLQTRQSTSISSRRCPSGTIEPALILSFSYLQLLEEYDYFFSNAAYKSSYQVLLMQTLHATLLTHCNTQIDRIKDPV